MTSFVWNRNPEEAYSNPYEYPAQDQFSREAKKFLAGLLSHLMGQDMTYSAEERTKEKAVWMLSVDLLDGLLENVRLIDEKRHRAASRLFRDSVETMDFLLVISLCAEENNHLLESWYNNETIRHGRCREILGKVEGKAWSERRSDLFSQLSKFTHRTYRALLKSYVLGGEKKIAYDGRWDSGLLVLPHTIAAYYAISADLICQARAMLARCSIVDRAIIDSIWNDAMEAEVAPQRFVRSYRLGELT